MNILACLLAVVALAGCSSAPPRPASVPAGDYASIRTYIDQLIKHEMARNDVVGLSIALVDDQRLVWAEGFGYADQAGKIPAAGDTVYRVGSIAKLFTAAAAMQLQEKGQLDIDAPLQNALPGFAVRSRLPDAAAVTPRLLMTHHAGLARDRLKGIMNADPRPFTEVAESLRDEYAAYAPGQVFSYSNVGATLLGSAIQQLSGAPFAERIQQSLLAPLGMANSSFDKGPSPSPRMAKGYRGRNEATEPSLRDVPAGGLNSTVVDLARFVSMVFAEGAAGRQQVLQPQSVREMLQPQNASALDLNFRVGLGWMLSTVGASTIKNGGPVAHHGGGTALFRSQLYILPEHKLGVVVLANSNTAGPVVDRVATEALSLALEAKTGIRQPQRTKAEVVAGPLPAATVADYAGEYATMAGFAKIYGDDKGLRVDTAGQTFKLVRRTDGTFGLEYALLGLFRLDLGPLGDLGFSRRAVAGHELLIAQVDGQELAVGRRIAPPATVGAWRSRLGDYEIENPGGDHRIVDRLRLSEAEGHLLLEMTMSEPPKPTLRMPLMPLSDSEGLLLSGVAEGGETVANVMVDGEERLAYSGYLLKRMR